MRGATVLFKRYGVPPEKRDWEVGYLDGYFWVLPGTNTIVEPLEHPEAEGWATVVPAAPEGKQAPTSLTVPNAPLWIDFVSPAPVEDPS